MKKLFSPWFSAVTVMVLSSPAFGIITRMTIINHSDFPVQCAFAQIANANPQAPEVTVFHWFGINNGGSTTFNGRTDGYYCEANGGAITFGGSNAYLCVSRQQYVNPFFKANSANDCNNFGGQMVNFVSVNGFGAQTITLNAPN